jgi:hypothetical protein
MIWVGVSKEEHSLGVFIGRRMNIVIGLMITGIDMKFLI